MPFPLCITTSFLRQRDGLKPVSGNPRLRSEHITAPAMVSPCHRPGHSFYTSLTGDRGQVSLWTRFLIFSGVHWRFTLTGDYSLSTKGERYARDGWHCSCMPWFLLDRSVLYRAWFIFALGFCTWHAICSIHILFPLPYIPYSELS